MLLQSLTRGALLAATAAALLPQGQARTIAGGPPDLERLVRASQVICLAEVQEVRTEFIDRRIETTYTLEVEEFLAGTGPKTFEMTVFGGAVEEPFPMAFIFDGMVVLSEQQDVMLFLSDRSANGAAPALARAQAAGATPSFGAALTPAFGDLGVFTVLTDPATGTRHVTQITYGAMGVAVTPQVNSLVVQRVESSLGTRTGAQAEQIPLEDIAVTVEQPAAPRAAAQPQGSGDEIPGLPGARTYRLQDAERILGLGAPPARSTHAGHAHTGDEEGGAASSSALRTLGDFTAEIEHILNEGGN